MTLPGLPEPAVRLGRRDVGLLCAICLLLYSVPLLLNPLLSTHEAVHCQNVREMLAGGDWIIPRYGGRPWLERPPLPHWITAAAVALTHQPAAEWAYRLGPLAMAVASVLLVAWMASVWFGRAIGLLSGVALATMREFFHYALAPEADIFLGTVVTATLACFVRAEFGAGAATAPAGLLGRRRWPVLAFFLGLGLTNMAKGLFFGMFFVLVPVTGYLLGQRRWSAWRSYLWLPGGMAFALTALAWPVAAYLRHPDISDLWASDYLGRLHRGFMREPFWYYLAQLPWVVFPWSLPAIVGLGALFRPALGERQSGERFVVVWALLTIVFLSIPHGKHHHYLLPGLGAWAVCAALGAVRLCEWVQFRAPAWVRSFRVIPALAGLAGDLVLVGLHYRFPGRVPHLPWLLAGWPVYAALAWWACTQRRRELAAVAALLLLFAGFWLGSAYQRVYHDAYRDDRSFAAEVARRASEGLPLCVLNDRHPLDASWMLFYLPAEARLLHNVTFLRDEEIRAEEVYLVARAREESAIRRYGALEVVVQSRSSRRGHTGQDLWTLYRLRYDQNLWRGPAKVPISPMQATGRDLGPYLGPT